MFVVVVNQPGCLPEADPIECETLEEARDVLYAEAMRSAEAVAGEPPEDVQDHYGDICSQVEPHEVVMAGGMVHTIYVEPDRCSLS